MTCIQPVQSETNTFNHDLYAISCTNLQWCGPTNQTGGGSDGSPTTTARQMGHVECERSHMSTQSTWNRCMHAGSCRTISPTCTSPRHMTHCAHPDPAPASPPLPSLLYANVGSLDTAGSITSSNFSHSERRLGVNHLGLEVLSSSLLLPSPSMSLCSRCVQVLPSTCSAMLDR